MFCFVDHFEPGHGKVPEKVADRRMKEWYTRYPEMARKHTDADGYHPKHTWFYPPHYYKREYFDLLNELCHKGYGEIEFHLHHGNDTSDSLRSKIRETLQVYSKHGIFVTAEIQPRTVYAFIHGDWALDNSREVRHCGVNDELTILSETGCFTDMTFPSLHSAQPQKINSIYYAEDDPRKPKSYDWGTEVRVHGRPEARLLMIQGPLAINWTDWHHRYYPAFETGEVVREYPATKKRIDFWIKSHIHVKGKPDWIFIKVHTHGAVDKDHETLLGEPRNKLHEYLEQRYNDGQNYSLHYVSAREMYNIIKAAEAGEEGNPNTYRNYEVPAYANMKFYSKQLYRLISCSPDSFQLELLEKPAEFSINGYLLRNIKTDGNEIYYRQDSHGLSLEVTSSKEISFELADAGTIKSVDHCAMVGQQENQFTFRSTIRGNGKIQIEMKEKV